jgi:hypothetical protein
MPGYGLYELNIQSLPDCPCVDGRLRLIRHIMSHRFGLLLGSKTILWEPPKIQIHTVSQSEEMEAIDAARNEGS